MKLVISIIRFPVAFIAILLIIISMVFALLIESCIAIPWLVILSIFAGSDDIEESWLSEYPNATTGFVEIIGNIFIWVVTPDGSVPYENLSISSETILFNIMAVPFLWFSKGIIFYYFGKIIYFLIG